MSLSYSDPCMTWVCLKTPKCVKTSAECGILYDSNSFDSMYIMDMGEEISKLMVLQSVDIREIAKAFGEGRIVQEKYTNPLLCIPV